mgnify:CR=1 FL=1
MNYLPRIITAVLLLSASCTEEAPPNYPPEAVAESFSDNFSSAPEPAPPPPNYAPAIESVLLADARTESHGNSTSRVAAMRAIDVSGAPRDFQAAYLEHIFAWERFLRARSAWTRLTTDEETWAVVIGGGVCAALGCERNPIESRLEAEERLQAEMNQARALISSTYEDVQRIAVQHGANLGVLPS